MELIRYVEELRHQLAVAAEAGGDDARAVAQRLTAPLEASVRLVLLDALADAANEITSELAPGSVEVRLRGRDPEFVVTAPPADEPGDRGLAEAADRRAVPVADGGRAPVADGDEGATSRITLRLPEHLKARVEEAAGHDGLSVNAWLVRAVAGALGPGDGRPADGRSAERRRGGTGQRFTGWAR